MKLYHFSLCLLSVLLGACSGTQQCDANQAHDKILALSKAVAQAATGTSAASSAAVQDELGLMRQLIAQGKFVEACAKAEEFAKIHRIDLTQTEASSGQPGKNSGQHNLSCSREEAAGKQKQIQDILKAEVDAGRKGPEIFERFNEDVQPISDMLSRNPAAACNLLDRLIQKYSLLAPHGAPAAGTPSESEL